MALKDLKSDLSKFRKPIETPLIEKKRVEVPQATNQTPLSQFVDSTPAAQKSQTTTPKQGVTPSKFDNSSKFIGETDPTKFDNSSKFMGQTDPSKFDNSSKFMGQTDPSKFDNSSKFIGETDPTKFDNSSNYLGETTPTQMSLKERFLGQTETTQVQQGDKFKGETETANITQGDRFKGQTTPQDYSNAEKFKGQTTPNEFQFTQNFLGETTPKSTNLSPQYLGETDTTQIVQGDKFKGQTDTTLVTYNPELEGQAKDPSYVDFMGNTDSFGFSPLQKHKSPTKFVGVDPAQTKFDGTTSLVGLTTPTQYEPFTQFETMESKFGDFSFLDEGLSFRPGYKKYKLKEESGPKLRYNSEERYEETYKSIGKLMEERKSPSFLDEMYAKYNLRDDSPNYLNLLRAPYILTGIQRKKISKGEPQFWDFGLGVDDGFIRGGIVASTTRAIADVLRLGSFFLSVKGLLWGVRQFASQKTNKYGRLWTPINLLASTLGQHIGFRPSRHGLLPGDPTDVYKKVIGSGYDDKLFTLYSKELINPAILVGIPFLTQVQNGGFDSVYGLGITNTTRYYNTFGGSLGNMSFTSYTPYGDELEYKQKFNPWALGPTNATNNNYEVSWSGLTPDDRLKFGLTKQTQQNSAIPIDTANLGKPTDGVAASSLERKKNLLESEGFVRGFSQEGGPADIADYKRMDYGTVSKRASEANSSSPSDFRLLEPVNQLAKDMDSKYGYTTRNRESKYLLAKPRKPGQRSFKNLFGADSTKYDESISDAVNKEVKNTTLVSDWVMLFFQKDTDSSPVQFRSTISGLTETFSPSWDSIKYPGRADKTYMYGEFERTLSFNFKVYAESRNDMKVQWKKLDELSRMTYPIHGGDTYTGHLVKFRLGNLYGNGKNGVYSFITSLSYTMPDDLGWELNWDGELAELPMGVDVSIGLTLLPSNSYYQSTTSQYSFMGMPKFK